MMTVGRKKRFADGATREDLDEKWDLSGMSLDSLPSPSVNFRAITKLDLSNNNLVSIPESLTARLLNLVVFDAHSNQLRALPNSIGCLAKLKVLNVSGNLIESLPITIENCRNLEELIANFNKLAKLPETIGFELINLKKLAVHSNKLVSLPYSTSHLTSLRVLDAHLNCLRSLPEDMESLTQLEVLDVSQNFQYLQSLPYSIGVIMSLQELDVSYNSISILPESMGCLIKLRILKVEGNPLKCPSMEVVEQGVDAVRNYLCARMNKTDTGSSVKKSWLGKIARWRTFIGSNGIRGEKESFLKSKYNRISNLATPRHIKMLSPLRLFSPQRTPPRGRKSI